MMTEIILSPFLQSLFEILIPMVVNKVKDLKLDLEDEIRKLRNTLGAIRAVLDVAEKRQDEEHVRMWLQRLKEVAYDVNDVLDEVAIEAMRRQCAHISQVRDKLSPLSLRRSAFKHGISSRITEIRKKLTEIANERQALHLGNTSFEEPRDNQQTSSSVVATVFGRNHDVQTILGFLLTHQYSETNIDQIAIVGSGGLGKTTVAQIVYNNESLAGYFHLKMWVYVPRDADVRVLIKATIESITGTSQDLLDLQLMQHHLQKLLEQKKFLLVFDDMWNESDDHWDKLKPAVGVGAKGSKILITTRSRAVAKLVDSIHIHELKALSYKDCLSLFNNHAFGDLKPEEYSDLYQIGRKIVSKCKGWPLAAKTFGRQLRFETNRDRWEYISTREIGELVANTDYRHTMPAAIKRCFAYCSIFPSNFKFEIEQLVQLWMAQDFVPSEEEGREYFHNMFHCCLFEYSHFDYRKTQQTYVMPDSVRSTAKQIAHEECQIIDQCQNLSLSENARHASLLFRPFESNISDDPPSRPSMRNNFELVYKAKGLYTLLLLGSPNQKDLQILEDLPKKLCRLRSLDLSDANLHELPDSIGDLKHLRYLALRNTKIKKLPKSVGNLYSLQTLGLRNCYHLIKLPKHTKNLANLRHLDLHLDDDDLMMFADHNENLPNRNLRRRRSGDLRSMPPEIGKLTRLRTLSRFAVSRKPGCGISELGGLRDLRRDLCITDLHCIVRAEDAKDANLASKQHLEMLELRWGADERDVTVETSVLESLRPYTNIKELRIEGYRGRSFPLWIASTSFTNLATIKLSDCKASEQLPQLGQLPSLKSLFIKGMDGISTLDCEFCGNGQGFRSLQRLEIESLPRWRRWSGDDNCELTSLRELVIRDCGKLEQITHALPQLLRLEIDRCPALLGLRSFPRLDSLDVKASDLWIWSSLSCLRSLSSLTLTGLRMPNPPAVLHEYTTIRRLELISCITPEYLPDDWLPTRLAYLKIKHCLSLRALPGGLQGLFALRDLQLDNCEKLASLPRGIVRLKSLESLEISDCPMLSSLPVDGLPTRLEFLSIRDCPILKQSLRSNRGQEKIAHIPSVWIDGAALRSTGQGHSVASTSGS